MKDNENREEKRSFLRREIREKISSFDDSYISKSSTHICMFIRKFIESKDGIEDVLVYNSYGREVRTDGVISFLLDEGYNVYLPIVRGNDMYAVKINKDTKYVTGAYGIKEPVGEIYGGGFDIAITPLLAFDKDKNRMGKGKGYYDRFFASHSVKLKLGAAFFKQRVESVYPMEHDVPMDVIITEEGICE